MPAGNGGPGRYRPGRPQVGRPRDMDGRPRSDGERRGGRTYRPGLHDWTPGSSAPAGRDDGNARPPRAPQPPGSPGAPAQRPGFAGRRRAPESIASRPGSMGSAGRSAGRDAGAAGPNDRNGAGRTPRDEPRWGNRPTAPGGFRTGMTGGRTRLGSDEPRDAGDRSRYRLRSGAENNGSERRTGAGQPSGARSRPPFAGGTRSYPGQGLQRGRAGGPSGPRPRLDPGVPATPAHNDPSRSHYADLDEYDAGSAGRSGDEFPFPVAQDDPRGGLAAAVSPDTPARAAEPAAAGQAGARIAGDSGGRRRRRTDSGQEAADANSAAAPRVRRRRAAGGEA